MEVDPHAIVRWAIVEYSCAMSTENEDVFKEFSFETFHIYFVLK